MDRTYDTVSVVINGNKIEFNQPPKIVNNRTLLPLRKIFETLGASVTWNENDKSITAKKGKTNITLFIDNNIAYVNNKEVKLDTPPTVINDNTMVPVRFISESLGCKVDWDEFLMQVDITESDNKDN